jgi:uncharacterized protein (DUF1330 family)
MPAYAIGRLQMRDPSWAKAYGPKVAELVKKHGGRYVVRGGAMERLEGHGDLPSSMAQARAWYHDPAYAPMIKLRQSGSDLDFVLIEGL